MAQSTSHGRFQARNQLRIIAPGLSGSAIRIARPSGFTRKVSHRRRSQPKSPGMFHSRSLPHRCDALAGILNLLSIKEGEGCAGGGCLLAGAPGEGKGEERRGWTWLARRLHERLSGLDANSAALTSLGQIGQVRFASGAGEPGGCVASRVWWIELRVMPDQRRSWAGGRRLARKVSRRYVP